jgi:hypothetical protein
MSSAAMLKAQDVETWLNAPGWDLSYEVAFSSSTAGKDSVLVGDLAYTLQVEQTFSAKLPLDVRSQGASLSMTKLSMGGTSDQEAIMNLVMKTDKMASWMNGGPSGLDDASVDAQMAVARAHMESLKGPGKVHYERVETGHGLITEMGTKYNLKRRTTKTGSGRVSSASVIIMFEMDAETGKYLLVLPYGFSDDSMTSLQTKVITETQSDGTTSIDSTLHATSMEFALGRIVIDEPAVLVGEVPVFEGALDPAAGKIAGERTVKAHFTDGASDVPGTFVFKYTLTPRR